MNILKRYFRDLNGEQTLITISCSVDEDFQRKVEDYLEDQSDIDNVNNGTFIPYIIEVELFDGENTFTDQLGGCVVKDPIELLDMAEEYGMIKNVIAEKIGE